MASPSNLGTTLPGKDVVPNFHQVDANLYRGGRPRASAETYLQLARLGIRTVVNLEKPHDAAKEKTLIEQANQRLAAQGKPPLDFVTVTVGGSWETFVTGWKDEAVEELFRKLATARKPALIHCHYGRDRTGAAVILYRLKCAPATTWEDAWREGRAFGFNRLDFGLRQTLARFRQPARLASLAHPCPEG